MIVGINQTIDLIQSERSESGEELSDSELALLHQFLVLLDIAAAGHNRELFVARMLNQSPPAAHSDSGGD